MTTEGRPESRHFQLRELADGVFAAIATEDGWAVGNAGFVDLGDEVVVFDTFSSHIAAADLKAAVAAATGKPVGYVVNSHPHRDHTKGNQVFADATIVATRKTTEVMTRNWQARTERVRNEGLGPIRTAIAEEFDAWASNPLTNAADQVLWKGYRDSLLQGLEDYQLKLPTVSFDTAMRFHGSKGIADAVTFGGGHSASDAILHAPEAGVAFLGDLLFVGVQPFLADGDPEEYLRILDRIEALDATTLVPGHGPVGSAKDLGIMRDYVRALEKAAVEARRSGHGPTEAAQAPIPPAFEAMKWRAFWRENLEFFARRGMAPPPPGI